MRKALFFLALILSIFFTAQAGYIIRGMPAMVDPAYLNNYTLTFDRNDEPVSAASMIEPRTGWHSIVIVQANDRGAYIFPITIDHENLEIEVRDFHRLKDDTDTYVLCGSRGTGATARAFVAVMRGDYSSMQFIEYPEADKFYSIWADYDPSFIYSFDGFFACGTKGTAGVIASIDDATLQLRALHRTDENWEYHKVIFKKDELAGRFRFVVSGRDPEYTRIG